MTTMTKPRRQMAPEAPGPDDPGDITAGELAALRYDLEHARRRLALVEAAVAFATGRLRWYARAERYRVRLLDDDPSSSRRLTAPILEDCGRRACDALEQLERDEEPSA